MTCKQTNNKVWRKWIIEELPLLKIQGRIEIDHDIDRDRYRNTWKDREKGLGGGLDCNQ